MKTNSEFPHATWRLLITPPMDGATNMAIDEAILARLTQGAGQPTLRFYSWQPGCLSLGYSQSTQDVDEAACQSHGFTWTRRATGGKAILHIDELTYSLISPKDDPRIVGGILRSYKILSQGLLRGLQKLGVEAEQVEKRSRPRTKAERQGPVCFDTPARYEITWQGRKLIGSAQLRRKNVVLQHGTLPLHGDIERILQVLHLSTAERARQEQILPERATTLQAVTGRNVSFDRAATALTEGFAEVLNLDFVAQPLSAEEEALVAEFRAEHYDNEEWKRRL